MKYLKTFADKKSLKPRVGDYVVLLNIYHGEDGSIIGKIIEINKKLVSPYEIIEINNTGVEHYLELSEIDFFSKTIEESELFIQANKYNL